LTRAQAREIDTGIGRLEIEFAGTVKKTMSRRQELKDITTGLDRMMALKRAREDRLVFIDTFLDFQRQYLVSGGGGGVFFFLFFAQCPRHGSSIIQWCFITRWFIHHSMVFVHHSMVTSSNSVFSSFTGYIIQWCFFIIQWLHHPMVFFNHSMVFFHHPMVLPSSSIII